MNLLLVVTTTLLAALPPCDAFSTTPLAPLVFGGNGSGGSSVTLHMMIDGSSDDDSSVDNVPLLQSPSTSTIPAAAGGDNEQHDATDNDWKDQTTPLNTAFTATPITVTTTAAAPISAANNPPPPEQTVNSATLRFNNRLNQLAKNWDDTTAPKAEALLLDALEKYQLYLLEKEEETEKEQSSSLSSASTKKSNNIIIPNTISFTNVITAWARCTRKDSAKRAQSLLDQMLSLYTQRNNNNDEGSRNNNWEHVKPNKISYNSVITAWARSNERGSARKAEDLLRNMYEFYNNESGLDINCKPDSRSFNAVINAVARSRDKNYEMGRLYDEGDTDLLPDALTFGAIINAYANSLEAGSSDKAAQLLMHMESLYQLGFENAKPTTFVYNACMNAFAKDPLICVRGGFSRAEKAEQLLDSMEKRYNEEKDWRIKPDIISYSTVINAHANSGTSSAGVNADAILRRMMHRYLLGDTKCRPNAIVFTAAIKAHSSAINATLSELDELAGEEEDAAKLQKQEHIKTTAKRCEDLLQQLCLLYQLPGNDRSLKPTTVTFELVTGALASAEDWEGVERIKGLREEGMAQHD
ncbi:hypothetical protein ACHAWC_010920 [Mediolabrus comicus]